MPRRWLWSVLDIVALICLGQATMLAQRRTAPLPRRLDNVLEFARAETEAGRAGTRIYETADSIVVALPSARPEAGSVVVEGGLIRFFEGADQVVREMPVPAAADARRYRVQRRGDEIRLVFAREADGLLRTTF